MLARLFPSSTLARYTGLMFLWRSLAFLAGIVIILQTLDLLGESGEILKVAGNGEADLWRYVSLRLPQLIALFLPFCVLLGTLLTLMTLNQNSEIVILKAAGISAHQILAPLILVALGVAAVSFTFNETVLTRAKSEFDRWKAADYHPVPKVAPTNTQVWVRVGADLYHADQVRGVGASTMLVNLTVYDRENDRLLRIVRADSAIPEAAGWRLRQVRRFDVASGRQERMTTLDLPSQAEPAQFTTQNVNADHLPFWKLWPAVNDLRAAGKPTDTLVAKLNHKISGPLSAALMPLLGAVAAFGLARSGRLFVRAVIGLALGFAFFVADNFAMAMADFGSLPPIAAAWAPFLLFLLVGEAVLFRTEE
ncbi:LPS export ABC transporter permease LptG [Sandaracinobacteroides saxicola]|uniref:LPS export ABC transporter permease LptG n=1 Tax=Sandaracinobacteroides saxicola TaxID=2759707 RepID=A0A7G5IKJ6_9SPHN|nr:LPS export ABC transporter permease LptG [Sandaracinobacteroides saxicola]QMW23888.1 LPS export ABC transporter permease LptG [Sandaracinobacteroides saxicola]